MFKNEDKLQFRNQNRSTVIAQDAMACTSHPLATLTAVETLKAGGNAVDAAIAANALLSVVEPTMCGPGGDLFAIVWIEKDKKLYGLNASGRSPYDWSLKDAKNLGLQKIDPFSPLAWSVPGCVSGWETLRKRFGKSKMADLLAPAIHYARNGFAIAPVIAENWASIDFKTAPTLAKTYAPGGKAPVFGDFFKNPNLADTFEKIAKGGADEFYKGQIAEKIVRFSKQTGGRFSMKDFADHTDSWVDPVSTNYRGCDVWELPPNGQGIAALQILNLLEHFNIASMTPNSPQHLHLLIEAKKLAFEDRAVYYADTDFADVPVKELISKEYAAQRVKLIHPRRAATEVPAGRISSNADTTYLTVADKDGNMVSLIQSIFFIFGSKFVPDNLGFVLQNRGLLFSLDPKALNKLEPHKRPFHTIIPAFMTKNGRPVLSFGVMGGSFQPQGHAQVLMNMIDFKMSPQQAGDQPRVEHIESSQPTGLKMVDGGFIRLEKNFPESTKRKLAEMGHKIKPDTNAFGGYQAIWRKEAPRRYFGASDPRKDGCALGY